MGKPVIVVLGAVLANTRLFRDTLHPAHVGDSRLLATLSARLQHAGLRIKRGYLIEQLSQGQHEDAGAAAHIE